MKSGDLFTADGFGYRQKPSIQYHRRGESVALDAKSVFVVLEADVVVYFRKNGTDLDILENGAMQMKFAIKKHAFHKVIGQKGILYVETEEPVETTDTPKV